MPFSATWMELETLILCEVRKRKTNTTLYIIYMWNLIYGTNEPFHRKESHGLGEKTCGSGGEGGGRRMAWESGVK